MLFAPLLWFRRVVLGVLILLAFAGFMLYVLANSTVVVKRAVDAFAPDYNLSYTDIKGNALTGFEITNPQYNHKSMAKKILLKWNPNTLAYKKLSVRKLHIKEADIDVINSFVAQFLEENTTATQSDTTNSDFTVDVKDVFISTKPLEIGGVFIEKTSLNSDGIVYKNNSLDAKNIDVKIVSDIATLEAKGKIDKNKLLAKLVLHPKTDQNATHSQP